MFKTKFKKDEKKEKKMNINPLDTTKCLGKFLNTDLFIPENVKIYRAEAGDKYFRLKEYNIKAKKVRIIDANGNTKIILKKGDDFCIPFTGLNSDLFYVEPGTDDEELQETSKKIKKNMDKKEADFVLKIQKEFKNKQLFFIRRQISPEIVKLLTEVEGENIQRAIIVHPCPIEKEGEKGKFYFGAFGYENIIIAVIE